MIERLRRWALPALTISSLIAAGVALDLTGALSAVSRRHPPHAVAAAQHDRDAA